MLQTTIETVDDVSVCRVEGELDTFAASALRDVLSTFCRVPRLLIDLTETTVLDVTCLGALLAGIRQVRESGGHVSVRSGHDGVTRVLRDAGVARIAVLGDARGLTAGGVA